ncbi:MAG TPA: hypothetical protein VFC44_10520 [Candidatus Saccharimonadales bacterium]|nr:hypothetical protein [Candidatus Saccharimonadales bacterium]
MNSDPARIGPQAIAAKTAALRDFAAPQFAAAVAQEPRLIELSWFIQWHFIQPGGPRKFAENFLARFSARVGTSAIRIVRADGIYTPSERQEIISSLPERLDPFTSDEARMILSQANEEMRGHSGRTGGWRVREMETTRPDLAFVSQQNHSYFYKICQLFALAELPNTLARFCTEPDFCLPDAWYFEDLQGALLEMMDAHAARAQQTIAATSVATAIFETLDFAWSERAMTEIVGSSRYGKSESVNAWCNMRPGRARLVKTPCDNFPNSLYEAIARAIGFSPTMKASELKPAIEAVFRQGDLGFVFDEAAWLLPQKFSARTIPFRLNYVRSQILDNGCPVALVTTPQFKDTAEQTYEKVSGFDMAQWRGRIMRSYRVPKDLPDSDLFAVVATHLPGLKVCYAKRVVGVALLSESFLFAVEKISKNARAEAKKQGRAEVQGPDVERAIVLSGYKLPAPPAPVEAQPESNDAQSHLDVHAGRRSRKHPPLPAGVAACNIPPGRNLAPAELTAPRPATPELQPQ